MRRLPRHTEAIRSAARTATDYTSSACEVGVQAGPIEVRAGIALAIRRHVAVRGDVAQGKRAAQRAQQLVQARILNVLERAFLDAFELHADREVVAAAAAAPARRAGVPRAPLPRPER